MKLKKSNLCSIGVFLILLIAFTKSLIKTLYGSNAGATIVLIIGMALVFAANIVNGKFYYKFTGFSLLWIATLAVALSNNYDLKDGNTMAIAQLIIGTLLVVLLQVNDTWSISTIKIIKGFALFHFCTGVIFLFARNILIKYIVPLFKLSESSEYYSNELINQIHNGYMTGLTSHYSTMGIYMSIGMCFFASNIFNDKDRIEIKDLVGILIMLTGTLLSGKRSALLFPALAVLIVYFLYFKPKNASRRYNYIAIVIIAILSALLIMTLIPGLGGAVGRIVAILGSTDLNDITNKRYEMLWLPAILLFLEKPITGIGWGNFKFSFGKYYQYAANQNNAHNVYLQLLCETGVLGSIIVLGAMIASVIIIGKTLSNWRKGKLDISHNQLNSLGTSMAMQIYFLLYAVSGNPLYDIQCYLPYMVAVAMGLATVNKIKKNSKEVRCEEIR